LPNDSDCVTYLAAESAIMIHVKITSIIWFTVYALDVYAIVLAVTRGQGVERTLAWLFAIIAFPGAGAVAYLLLANPSVRRAKKRKRVSAAAVRALIASRTKASKSPQRLLDESILNLATSLTGLAPSEGNSVELLIEDYQAFEQIEGALKGAKRSIWAEYYIIRRDVTGDRFLDILLAKVREGVEVRLIYDAVGSVGIDAKRLKAIRAAGGEVEAFLPINPLRRRWSVHLRNHRKMIIVDGEIAFTGGMNVGDEYSGRARRKGKTYFHDTHLKLQGTAVGDLSQTFAEDWSFATGDPIAPIPHPAPLESGSSIVTVVPSGPDQEHNANGMVYFAGIAFARERVYLSSPYFIPDEPTLRALISAAMRGVDVRVMAPARCDVALVGPAARSYFPSLVRGGVRVFEYQPSMLHAKMMVVDGTWGIVGSANVDIRSFLLNFELGTLVFDPAFAALLEKRFISDLENSIEVTAEALAQRSFPSRLLDGAIRLLSPLL